MISDDPADWIAWRHKERGHYCYVPADVVIVSVNGKTSHLGRRGYSPLIPLSTLPVRFDPLAEAQDYSGWRLLEEYEPA